MKNIIITGGCGYIGSRLVPHLLENGYTIKVLDRMDFGNNLQEHKNLTIIKKDILLTTVEDFEGFDAVIHLAGLSNDPMANFSPSDNFVQNLAVTGLCAFNAKKANVKKFIFAGSCSVYGAKGKELCDEESKIKVDFPYGISKLQAEKSLLTMQEPGFKVILLRQATVFGWARRMRTDLVVNTMTKTSILNKRITVNNGSIQRPLIHLADLVKCYQMALEKDFEESVINVTSKNYSIIEIANEVKAALRKHNMNPEIIVNNVNDPRSYLVDNSLKTKLFGAWEHVTIEEAVDELIKYFPTSAKTEWENPSYINFEMYKKNFLGE